MKLTLKGSEGAGRGKRKDQAFGLCFKIWQILTLTRDLKVVRGRRMRKVERTEEQREQKNIAQRQRLWHPQHKTAQSRPSESKSHLETRVVLNRGVGGHKHPTSWNGSFCFCLTQCLPIRLSFIKTHLIRFITVWCVLAPNVSKDVSSAKNKIWVEVKISLRQEYIISPCFSIITNILKVAKCAAGTMPLGAVT